MSRARAAVIVAAALAVVVLGALGARPVATVGARGVTPTTTTVPAAPSTTTTTVAVPTTTTVAVPTTSTAPIAVRRGGAEAGSIAKPEREQWSVREMATTALLCVVALAAAGYAYGRIRSVPPRHPDLVHEPPEY